MYKNWPTKDQLRVSMNQGGIPNEGSFQVDLERESMDVPAKVEILLIRFGWEHSQQCPNTNEQLFQKKPNKDATDEAKAAWDFDLQNGHWYWYEAMAYEFGKFISIDTDVDWSKSHPSNVGGSAGATPQQAPAGV